MRKLLYPFLLCVSLIACNGIHYGSDKAFTLSDMDYSVLLSMEKEQLDSVIRILLKMTSGIQQPTTAHQALTSSDLLERAT